MNSTPHHHTPHSNSWIGLCTLVASQNIQHLSHCPRCFCGAAQQNSDIWVGTFLALPVLTDSLLLKQTYCDIDNNSSWNEGLYLDWSKCHILSDDIIIVVCCLGHLLKHIDMKRLSNEATIEA